MEHKQKIFNIHRKHSDKYDLNWTDKSIWEAIEYWSNLTN